MCTYIFIFKFYGKLLSSIKISVDIVCKSYIFGHSNGIQATKSTLQPSEKLELRDSEKENKRVLTSNNCCHLLKFMLMQSIVMDLVRLSKYWKWHLKDAYEYCSPSKKLITSTFSLYLRPNKKYVVREMRNLFIL